MIPLHRPCLGKEELEAVESVFQSGWLGLGEKVKEFEATLSAFLGVPHVVCVNSGTSALFLSLMALDIREPDEVIMPSLTFVSCLQAALMVGAKVRFCDIDPITLNLDVSHLESLLSPKTRAILSFHCSGFPCDLDDILRLCRQREIRSIEDAAHALGSQYRSRRIGAFSDATCFSFDPIKLITCGEGGAIVVQDKEVDRRLRSIRNLGMEKDAWSFYREGERREHKVHTKALRFHMSDLNAAMGLVQMRKIDLFIRRRQEIAQYYDSSFKGIEGIRTIKKSFPDTVPFNYVLHVPGKGDALISWLNRHGIQSSHLYTPNHLQPICGENPVSLPVTETVSPDLVALPLFPDLTDSEVERVHETVLGFFGRSTE